MMENLRNDIEHHKVKIIEYENTVNDLEEQLQQRQVGSSHEMRELQDSNVNLQRELSNLTKELESLPELKENIKISEERNTQLRNLVDTRQREKEELGKDLADSRKKIKKFGKKSQESNKRR